MMRWRSDTVITFHTTLKMPSARATTATHHADDSRPMAMGHSPLNRIDRRSARDEPRKPATRAPMSPPITPPTAMPASRSP